MRLVNKEQISDSILLIIKILFILQPTQKQFEYI